MRVAFWHNLGAGGGLRVLRDQACGLRERGHVVRVWTPPTAERGPWDWADVEVAVTSAPRLRPPSGGRLTRHQVVTWPWQASRALLRHGASVAAEMRRWKPDIVLLHPCRFFATSPVARFTDSPTLHFLHEPNRRLYEAFPKPPSWIGDPEGGLVPSPRDVIVWSRVRHMARYELTNVLSVDRVVTSSAFAREALERAYGLDGIAVCPPGVGDMAASPGVLSEPGSPPSHPYLVAVGRLDVHKRAILAVTAIAYSGTGLALHWIGESADPRHRDDVERHARSLGVDLHIHIRVPDFELSTYLRNAVAHLSVPFLEPLGLVPLEAALVGTPTIGVAEGGLRETIKDGVTGLLSEPSAEAIAAAIRLLATDVALRTRLGQQAQSLARDAWSLAGAADKLEGLLESSVGNA